MRLSLPLLLLFALPAFAWEAKPLRQIAVYPERSAQAQVVSLNESRIAAELSARIVSLAVEPGQRITRGSLIVRLDCRDFELAVERAEAAISVSRARARLAELQHSRSVKLAGEGFLSKDALDSRFAELGGQPGRGGGERGGGQDRSRCPGQM
jgi:multidrug resistance efflux pump